MQRRILVGVLGAGLVIGLSTSKAKADDHGQCRAGCPQRVAWYARPSESRAYTGYYVGGGSAVAGSYRCPNEGTWGWDYDGWLLPHRVLLSWSHGWRYQGGTGAYKVDGPPVPDVPALLNPANYSRH
jgi:hypothetical protein